MAIGVLRPQSAILSFALSLKSNPAINIYMSKAFTREDDVDLSVLGADEDERDARDGDRPSGAKNYITPVGLKKLRDELNQLFHDERPKLVQTVSWAASNGDRSENGDYIYGKRRLREIDRRLRFIKKRLDNAEVVDPSQIKDSKVVFGATVTVQDEDGKKFTYQIVGEDESDPSARKISWVSPMASALLGKLVGEMAVVKRPAGDADLEIIKIEYKPVL